MNDSVDQTTDHPDADSFARRMDRHNPVQVDALVILIGHHLKFRMLHDEAFAALLGASENNDPSAGGECLLNMEEIKPTKRDPSRQG
jgi:hypothetical protein